MQVCKNVSSFSDCGEDAPNGLVGPMRKGGEIFPCVVVAPSHGKDISISLDVIGYAESHKVRAT